MKRPWALPLTPLWALGAAAKNYVYEHSSLPIRHLQKPVISVGSLSAGGAGKTPVVIALAHLLARHNIAVDVLSRGYGRGSGAIERVDPAGPSTRFGDEPLEIAQSHAPQANLSEERVTLSEGWGGQPQSPDMHESQPPHATPSLATIPVFVGADRHAAGQLAEATLPYLQGHLLDDGFQHRRLARTLDLVLLTLDDTCDRLLPAGNLREPLASLRRANAIILREEEASQLAPIATRCAHHAQLWLIRRTLRLPLPPPQNALAFCGLARPSNFFEQLRQGGCTLAARLSFPDHYAYSSEDISALCAAAQRLKATAFISTVKDAVKLPPPFRERLEAIAPFHIAPLVVEFLDSTAILRAILAACTLPGARAQLDTSLSPYF